MAKIGEFFLIEPAGWLFPTQPDVMAARARAEQYDGRHKTYDGAERTIEEFVRQWAVRQLLDVYGYPVAWLGERLIIEEPVKMGASSKEADISLRNESRRTFLYVETVVRGCSEREFLEKERQLETYLAATHTATIGLVTDGDTTRALRKKVDPNDFDYIPDIPAYGAATAQKARLTRDTPDDESTTRRTGLKLLSHAYEKKLFDCHSAIRDTDGLHADEALDELSKALYTKIYDERLVLKRPAGAEFDFQTYGTSNPSDAASKIRELYEDARDIDISIYAQRIPGYERSRGVFKAPIRLSDAALYRVVELLQEFSLVDSPIDVKGRAFQQVLGPAIRAGMGQYFTPDEVVDMAVQIAAPQLDDMLLDPFCGSGHFLTRSLDFVLHENATARPEAIHEFKFFHLHGIEKSERMVRIAMTDMMLHDDGHTNIRNTDSLLSFENYPDIVALGGDRNSDPAVFDLILTNPPFGSIMKSEVMEILGRFQLGHKRRSLPLEVLGLERSLQFLKPGGKLGIVLPDGVLKNKNMGYVRTWLHEVAEIKAVISLPIETFAPYGAAVKTSLAFFQKAQKGQRPDPSAKAFLAEIESLGYNTTGRPTGTSEVIDVVSRFHNEIKWSKP